MKLRAILLTSCVVAGAAAWTVPAAAQSATTGNDGVAGSQPRNVDEIVVTAQKREQSLQNVPIVVTAITAQALQDAGVKDIKDLTVLTPGLLVTSTSSEVSTTARIRGVGTVGDNLGLESSVGVVVDGVYRPRNGVGFGDLGELSRVEVLKGPQGTLFGKNTTAGVINVVTAKPTFKLGLNAELTVTNYDGYGGSASLNVPVIDDKLAVRVFFVDRERSGFESVRTGVGPRTRTDDYNRNFYSIRAQALWTPTPNVEVLLEADHTKRKEACCAAVQILEAGTTQNVLHALDPKDGGVATVIDPFNRVTYSNRDTPQNIDEFGVSGQVDWTTPWLGDAKLTSITAYRHWKRTGFTDPDYTSVDILQYDPNRQNAKFNQFSEELRYAGHTDRLDWLVGAFYAREDLTQNVSLEYGNQFEQYGSALFSGGASTTLLGTLLGRAPGTSFVAGQGQNDNYDQRERSLAVFTNNNYKLTDKLEITLGARYTSELKRLSTLYSNTDGAVGCSALVARGPALGATAAALAPLLCGTYQNPNFNNLPSFQRRTEERVTGTAKAAYRFNPDLLTYVSYARGYKAGGFNLDRSACGFVVNPACGGQLAPVLDTSFKAETNDSYEVGFKSTLFGRKLLFNATGFYQEFQNFQLNAFNGLVFTVISVPQVTSAGADVDVAWFATDRLKFNGGVTYADTRYADRDTSALGPKCTAIAFGATATQATPAGCSLLPGSRLSLAPLWSASVGATYEQPLGPNLKARLAVDAKYSSDYNTGSDLNPVKIQPAYTIVNARVVLAPLDEKVSLELFAQNLFDEHYIQVAFDATAQSRSYDAFLGTPRVFGATVRAKF